MIAPTTTRDSGEAGLVNRVIGQWWRLRIDLAIVLSAVAYGAPVGAGDWRITPGLTVGEVYTDNVSLAPSEEKRSEFVTTVIPSLAVRGLGARIALGFNYNLELLYRARDERTDTNHQLAGDARTEVVRDWLYLDATTTFSQANLVDITSGADNITDTPDRTDVLTYGLKPFISHRFTDLANVDIGYAFQGVDNQRSFDSISQNVTAQIRSGTRFLRLPWVVTYDWQKIDPSEGEQAQFQRIQGRLGYRLTDQLGVFGAGGYEDNDFTTTRSETSGFTWQAGAFWQPSRRTSLEGSYGERPFGGTYAIDFSYRQRRLVWQAGYDEDFTTVTQAELERQFFLIEQPVTVQPGLAQVPLPSLTQDTVFLRKRFESSLAYVLRRGSIGIALFDERREFELTGEEQTVLGGEAALQRQLSRRMGLTLSGLAARTHFPEDGHEDILWSITARLARQFGRNVAGAVEYRRQERESDLPTNDYTENRVTLGLQVAF